MNVAHRDGGGGKEKQTDLLGDLRERVHVASLLSVSLQISSTFISLINFELAFAGDLRKNRYSEQITSTALDGKKKIHTTMFLL